MNHHVRNRKDTFIGMKAFREANPEDFPARSVEGEQMDEIAAALGEIEEYGGHQALGDGKMRFTYYGKRATRKNLKDALREISTLAPTMTGVYPGIDRIFRVPKNLNDATLLALGHSFRTQAAPYQREFSRRGLNEDFLDALQTAIDDFEASLTPPEMARELRVEATARLNEAVRRGMRARRILLGLLKIKYRSDPGKMREWLSASHLDRQPANEKTVGTSLKK